MYRRYIKMTFGEHLKSIRLEAKLSLRKLSENTGLSRGYISKVENGKSGIPGPDIIRKLSSGLGVYYSNLMIAAGHVSEEEWSSAFIQEDFRTDDDVVYERAKLNRESPRVDLQELLENKNSLTYNGWELNEVDRQQAIDMLSVLFPSYTKTKRSSE